MTGNELDLAFAALSDPTRRRIIELLSDGRPMRVADIAGHFDATRQAITRHLDVLCAAGATRTEWRGRERYSSINDHAFDALRSWLGQYDRFWNDRLGELRRLVEKKD